MLAQVLVSPNLAARQQTIQQILTTNFSQLPDPDVLLIEDKEKLGVEQIRKIQHFLSIKPYRGDKRAVAIISAQDLTTDAQNSLLKLLEEPPATAIILLGVSNDGSLLPTVLSRCQVKILENAEFRIGSTDLIKKMAKQSVPERFTTIEKLEDKEGLLQDLLIYYQEQFKDSPKLLPFIEKLIQAEEWESQNVNIRAILEYLMLNWPDQDLIKK